MTTTSVFSHLYAIEDRLDNEKARLRIAENAPKKTAKVLREIAFRKHEIMMAEREVAGEKDFLRKQGIEVAEVDHNMSLDDILAELDI